MKVYMCLSDYNYELGNASGAFSVYGSIDELKENRPCVEECGIAELTITGMTVAQEPNSGD